MIEWLRRVFAARRPDPMLAQAKIVHAQRAEKVPATVAHADEVATTIIESREDGLRDSFLRAGQRLARR